jgi:hypothetical protein
VKPESSRFVSVTAIWYERYLECSRTYGTDVFSDSVWRFYHSLLNLAEGKLAIRDMVDDYLKNIWYPKINKIVAKNTEGFTDVTNRDMEKQITESEYIFEVFDFIKQTIQDSGVGWQTFSYSDAGTSDIDEAMRDTKN